MIKQITCLSFIFALLIPAAHAEAASRYQIDLIGFLHVHSNTGSNIQTSDQLYIASPTAVLLKSGEVDNTAPYQLQPTQNSRLKYIYAALKLKPLYQPLFHLSWIQPGNQAKRVRIPLIESKGWQVQGEILVKRPSYYLFETELYLATENQPSDKYIVSQKRRLKEDTTYYLDDPKLGLIVKIHALA